MIEPPTRSEPDDGQGGDGESASGQNADGDRSDPTAAAVERIRARGRTVRDRQVEQALSALDGEVSEEERRAIEALADRLVDRLLAVPEHHLTVAVRDGNDQTVERALDLFGDA